MHAIERAVERSRQRLRFRPRLHSPRLSVVRHAPVDYRRRQTGTIAALLIGGAVLFAWAWWGL